MNAPTRQQLARHWESVLESHEGAPIDEAALEFAPDAFAAKLEALHAAARAQFQKELETSAPMSPMAEQHYRLALAALEQAGAHARLADYNHSRGD